MKIEILKIYENLDDYIINVRKNPDNYEKLWDEYAIKPYWDKIAQWAPFDMSDRKPKAIKDVDTLSLQIELLKKINLDILQEKFNNIVSELPNYDDDPFIVALYPLDNGNKWVKDEQNGVWGCCVFGNIIININPLAETFENWIPYVFAHEYHHSVWGNYWNVIHGGASHSLLEAMLIDGQADTFAKSLNPLLSPKWLSKVPAELETEIWLKHYSPILNETVFNYDKYMFGDEKDNIPWCSGYFFGYKIIKNILKSNPNLTFKEILETPPESLYSMSNYSK